MCSTHPLIIKKTRWIDRSINSLKDENESDIKTLCLYEDISEEISENTECKPISIKDVLIHKLGDLRRSREFNRLYIKS